MKFAARAISVATLCGLVAITGASAQGIRQVRRSGAARTNNAQAVKSFRADTPTPTTSTLNGVISDTMCRASKHDPAKGNEECIRHCTGTGSKFALISDGKVYTLHGDKDTLSKLAGRQVSVQGTVNAYDVTVSTVAETKQD